MSSDNNSTDIPQWKKDLIARLRNQNKRFESATTTTALLNRQQLVSHQTEAVQQPSGSSQGAAAIAVGSSNNNTNFNVVKPSGKMVQERVVRVDPPPLNGCHRTPDDSDSSEEDLRYGPGIVSKLKNKYLSLALRESNARSRPSILPMRKAASMENILDDNEDDDEVILRQPNKERLFQSRKDVTTTKSTNNRFHRTPTRVIPEMKRARSVEAISRNDILIEPAAKQRESLPEDILITGNRKIDKEHTQTKQPSRAINRPKRLQPIMNEREKPPADVVKQAKLIFERRPEQRTKAPPLTGEVAAKVDSFNSIVKAKIKKPPVVKIKPTAPVKNGKQELLPSPIPDVSRIDFHHKVNEVDRKHTKLSETPDLILTSSPIIPQLSPTEETRINKPIQFSPITLSYENTETEDDPGYKLISPDSLNNINKASGTAVFNFTNKSGSNNEHVPPVNKNILNTKTPPSEPLKIEVNGHDSKKKENSPRLLLQSDPSSDSDSKSSASPPVTHYHPRIPIVRPTEPPPSTPPIKPLTVTEIEKNHINTVKSLQQQQKNSVLSNNNFNNNNVSGSNSGVDVKKNLVPRKRGGVVNEPESNTSVFNFTSRKDVPDYISNDRSRSPGRPDLPKPGEGGIILIPGASLSESFTDEDDEIKRSLEAPPSPCDVTFLNDNILIDGKSSLSQKTKRSKMRISFVDAGPQVFEYPSETSLLVDDFPTSPAQLGHTVPNLTGSTLANYTPKSTEDFQPGVTRTTNNIPTNTETDPNCADTTETVLDELEQPIQFSAGTNSDILF